MNANEQKLSRNLSYHRIAMTTLKAILQEMERGCKCCAVHRTANDGHNLDCPVYRGLLSIKLCQDADQP